ncbi:ATP-dependent Lon protease [Methanolinea mesophila]|uniref:BREX system Lon protease-like protein BrxL n=1 Tax=Methanolinea mesophila TaxID=547055 RepID=UPI001AEB18BC|nr:BREX system Lon protease-like protein BrxL [Methanolinea mesophila]MBP1928936.1 ATP-dependent Lon protease [Methanolinea mesophila]
MNDENREEENQLIPFSLDDSKEANEYKLNELDYKIIDIFPGEAVNKKLTKTGILTSRALPSFVSDWLISKFSHDEKLETLALQRFLDSYLPDKSKAEEIKFRIKNSRERIKLLTNFRVIPDIRSNEDYLEIPILDIIGKEGSVDASIIDKCPELLNGGMWGVGELIYSPPDKKKKDGKIVLKEFTPFRPYHANIDYYRQARLKFSSTYEWIDFLLKNMEYDPEGYSLLDQKIKMISRLLPFVEPRINLIELASKGTGKSYVFGRLSKYGWLVSGGSVSRAQLFYDISRKKRGLITRFDYIALDEIQTITFGSNPDEVIGALKGYLESGQFRIASIPGEADAGFIILGNIPINDLGKPINKNFFESLPPFMREAAFIDRFHGFIEGWKLPRIQVGSIGKGYAINSEFFSEILHSLRTDTISASVVDSILEIPKKSDKRDATAIARMATGFLKLFFPNVRSIDDVNRTEFEEFCFRPAFEMRQIIREQLHRMDEEYSLDMPEISIKKR